MVHKVAKSQIRLKRLGTQHSQLRFNGVFSTHFSIREFDNICETPTSCLVCPWGCGTETSMQALKEFLI